MAPRTAQPEATAAQAGALARAVQKLSHDRIVGVAVVVLVLLYFSIAVAGFLAPYSAAWSSREMANAPPTPIYMIDAGSGSLTWPYVFRYEKTFNPDTFSYAYAPLRESTYPVRLFHTGEPYKLLGFIPLNVHLFGVDQPARISLLGNDINGRDIFSRMFYGGQVSLTIGFLSLLIVFPIGMIYGGISGYFGGKLDNLMMRVAEVVMSIPTYFLLVSLAAILPPGLSSAERFTMVILILAFIGWASLARVIRGMVLSVKNQEFIEAARAMGVPSFWIIVRHILPQTMSYVLVAVTLSVPGYILAESGLSFLGLGIQQPDASWGNMLKEAQDVSNIINRPQMMMPGFLIFLAVLAFNVIGDALRDALDPKSAIRR
ncbi:MAG: ABC transporter permease [Vampirovibrionales bacterium]|nr:ABC transporter permease [Vampirovibrionales bacterium]